MTGSLRRWICGKGGRRLALGYDLGGRLGIDVVVVTMTGVEHKVRWVGFGEVALVARIWDGRLLEEECLVPHELMDELI
jgi:hypothetical protein